MQADHEAESVKEQCEELLRKLDQMDRNCTRLSESLQEGVEAELKELGGLETERMLLDEETAEHYLQHADAGVRTAALYLLIMRRGLTEEYGKQVEELAFGEERVPLRRIAFRLLPLCSNESALPRLGKPLARVVRDTNQPDEIRLAAYWTLIRLHGSRPIGEYKYRKIRSLEDVYWPLIDALIAG
jgi:hypothetical protein